MAKKPAAPAANTPPAAAPTPSTLKNRIIGHRTVRAADLIPHALNPRTHGASQREALRAVLDHVGLARSSLAYVANAHKHLGESAPLTLIDGHLRRETLQNEVITVEILDVNDEEAKMLLLTMDPLSQLAGYDESKLSELREAVTTDSDALSNLWASVADGQRAAERAMKDAAAKRKAEAEPESKKLVEKYVVIIECADETQQVEALTLAKEAGFKCRAVMS